MPVDRSFTMKGFGTVVTGSVMSGSLKLTDQVEMLPAGKVLRLRGLQRHNEKVDLVQCGDRAALNFSGIQKDSILPPDENAITLQSFLVADSNVVRTSIVFPEILVITTSVFLSTVLGSSYPFTTVV